MLVARLERMPLGATADLEAQFTPIFEDIAARQSDPSKFESPEEALAEMSKGDVIEFVKKAVEQKEEVKQ